MSKRTKESKKRINSLILLLAFTSILLITSIYAWFSTQKDVSLTNLQGQVEVAEGLEISLDAINWSQSIDLSDSATLLKRATNGTTLGAWSATANKVPEYLLPVSTTGAVATNDKGIPMYRGTVNNGIKLSEISRLAEATATDDDLGFIAFDIFLKDSSKTGETKTLQLNAGSSLNVITGATAGADAFGLLNCVRVGFGLAGGSVNNTVSSQSDITTATTGTDITDVAIWEPYSNSHVQYIVTNNNKLTNGNTADSLFTTTTSVKTYGLLSTAVGQTISNVYDYSSTHMAEQKTLKTTQSSATETKGQNIEGVQNLVKATDGSTAFTIPANKICRVRVYVWLEGQDVDCINYASHGEGIELNIGLVKDATVGDGAITVTP